MSAGAIPEETWAQTCTFLLADLRVAEKVLDKHLADRIGVRDPELVKLHERIMRTLDVIDRAARDERGAK